MARDAAAPLVIQWTPALFALVDDRTLPPLPASDSPTYTEALQRALTTRANGLIHAVRNQLKVSKYLAGRAIELLFATWADYEMQLPSESRAYVNALSRNSDIVAAYIDQWTRTGGFFSSTEKRDEAERMSSTVAATAPMVSLDLTGVVTGEEGPDPNDPLAHLGDLSPTDALSRANLDDDERKVQTGRLEEDNEESAAECAAECAAEETLDIIFKEQRGMIRQAHLAPFTPPPLDFPLPTDEPSLVAILRRHYHAYLSHWLNEAYDADYASSLLNDWISRRPHSPRDLLLLVLMPHFHSPIALFEQTVYNDKSLLEAQHHVYLKGCNITAEALSSLKVSPNKITAKWAREAMARSPAASPQGVLDAVHTLGLDTSTLSTNHFQLLHGGQTSMGADRHLCQISEIRESAHSLKITRYFTSSMRVSASWAEAVSADQANTSSIEFAERALLARGFADPTFGGKLIGEDLLQAKDYLEYLAASLGGSRGTNVQQPGDLRRHLPPSRAELFTAAELAILDPISQDLRDNPPRLILVQDSQPPVSFGPSDKHWTAAHLKPLVDVARSLWGDKVRFVDTSEEAAQLVAGGAGPVLLVVNLRGDNKVRGRPYSFPPDVCRQHLERHVLPNLPSAPIVVFSVVESTRLVYPTFMSGPEDAAMSKGDFARAFTAGNISLTFPTRPDAPFVVAKPLSTLASYRLTLSPAPTYAAVTTALLYSAKLARDLDMLRIDCASEPVESVLEKCNEVQHELASSPLAAVTDFTHAMLNFTVTNRTRLGSTTDAHQRYSRPPPSDRGSVVARAARDGYIVDMHDYETLTILSNLGYGNSALNLVDTFAASRCDPHGPVVISSLGQPFVAKARPSCGSSHASHHICPLALAFASVQDGVLRVRLAAEDHTHKDQFALHVSLRRMAPGLSFDFYMGMEPVQNTKSMRIARFVMVVDPSVGKFRLCIHQTTHRSRPLDVSTAAGRLFISTWDPTAVPLMSTRSLTGYQHGTMMQMYAQAAREQGLTNLSRAASLAPRVLELVKETGDFPVVDLERVQNWWASHGVPYSEVVRDAVLANKWLHELIGAGVTGKRILDALHQREERSTQLDETIAALEALVAIEARNAELDEAIVALEALAAVQARNAVLDAKLRRLGVSEAKIQELNEGGQQVEKLGGEESELEKVDVATFTRSLAVQQLEKGIRVVGVAPGPVYTPLQPASRPAEQMEGWSVGSSSLIHGRVGQPAELGESYVYLATSNLSTGTIVHPNSGQYHIP